MYYLTFMDCLLANIHNHIISYAMFFLTEQEEIKKEIDKSEVDCEKVKTTANDWREKENMRGRYPFRFASPLPRCSECPQKPLSSNNRALFL